MGTSSPEPADPAPGRSFDEFVDVDGERLRRVLVARHGVHDGNDLTADALTYAWEHWPRLSTMAHPIGYLYRVAQTNARVRRRWGRPAPYPPEPHADDEGLGGELGRALSRLPLNQRTCVVLVHVFGWSYVDVAVVLDCTTGSVRNHVHRGMRALRAQLGGSP